MLEATGLAGTVQINQIYLSMESLLIVNSKEIYLKWAFTAFIFHLYSKSVITFKKVENAIVVSDSHGLERL